jgi:hypothetical protein
VATAAEERGELEGEREQRVKRVTAVLGGNPFLRRTVPFTPCEEQAAARGSAPLHLH